MSAPNVAPRLLRLAAAAASVLLAAALRPATAACQDRLLNLRAFGIGGTAEVLSFGGGGFWQRPLPGQDSVRVRRVSQLSIPLTTSVPFSREWTVDVTAVYATGRVHFDRADAAGALRPAVATLAGVSDLRVRMMGRLFDDRVILVGGFNAPSGRTSLDSAQLLATRVLVAPALGLSAPPLGGGPSGTLGAMTARAIGQWAVVAGVSYERRGTYAPIIAPIAGLTSLDYAPGDVVRLSLAGDGIVGRGRLSATLATDFSRRDHLRGAIAAAEPSAAGGGGGGGGGGAGAALATVQLGPVIAADVQYHIPEPALRDLVFYTSLQYRAPYARDDVRTAGTRTVYLVSGLRGTVPLARSRDAFAAADVRYSNGLTTGGGLTTVWYTAGGLTAGLAQHLGARLTAQPFVRGQIGRVIGRGTDFGSEPRFGGATAGLTLVTRF